MAKKKKVVKTKNGQVVAVKKVKRVKKTTQKTTSTKSNSSFVDLLLGKHSSNNSGGGNDAKSRTVAGYTQDLVPVEDIVAGIIKTTDGRYIRIMEVLPSNYEQISNEKRNMIIESFVRLFRICPIKVQFKTVTEHINVEPLVRNIQKINKNITSRNIKNAESDYIESLRTGGGDKGIVKHYYIIFEYEKQGIGTPELAEVYSTMNSVYMGMARVMEACGNSVVTHDDENMFLLQVLYNFYNRKSARREDYLTRYDRIWDDRRKYYQKKKKKMPPASMQDFVAPRGIDLKRNHDFFSMDGLYYTYLTITDKGYPTKVNAGWLNVFFDYGVGVDVDFYIDRMPKEQTKYKLQRMSVIKTSNAMYTNDVTKVRDLQEEAANSEHMLESLKNGDDVFGCVTILTLWDEDPAVLLQMKSNIMTDLKSNDIYVEASAYNCEDYLRMTAPLLDIDKRIWTRNARNFTTNELASIYNMTAYQLFDETGYCMGINLQNGAVVSLNNFNTHMFKNGNMLIIGSSGAGKSFTEMFIGRKQFLTGIGTFYILPVKGYEYRDACESLDGEYVHLVPGSPDCINIMEIRPQGIFKRSNDDDEDEDSRSEKSQSLMAKKISSLAVWIQLLIPPGDQKITSIELNRFNREVASLYGRFEINEDNNSIFDEQGNLKPMPTINDLYELLQRDMDLNRISSVLLPFVDGSCRNMNGQTNVDLSKRCIVFDVDEALVGEDLIAAFLYIAFDCAYDMVKADANNFDVIFLDEVWKLMKTESCAKQVQKIVKLIRGYAGAAIMATQELTDFVNDPGGFGKSVIANTEIKFLMNLQQDEAQKISTMMHLTRQDLAAITTFTRGQGLIVANDKRVQVQVQASELEISLFTTDLNVKKAYKKKMEGKV